MQRRISRCRACGNSSLASLLSLGEQCLTGIFPKDPSQQVQRGRLELVKCQEDQGQPACGLVQLRDTTDLEMMYGDNYGYRSALNRSMVEHLKGIAAAAQSWVSLQKGDLVLDIGSNDGTSLKCYDPSLRLVGIDPTAVDEKFGIYYPEHIQRICAFFSAQKVREAVGSQPAKIVTSIAMFYDLEEPQDFVNNVRSVLHDDGVWVFEQSYLPLMLERNSYDTICHEHLEYYGLRQVKWLLDRSDFKIIDIETNDINGGSFKVTAAPTASRHPECRERIETMLQAERACAELSTYRAFEERVQSHRQALRQLLEELASQGKKVMGYGASTKGNVLLQYCGLDQRLISGIVEVNEEKFGSFTPGTGIPIVPESDTRLAPPDYFLVLPWHFRDGILKREQATIEAGTGFIFPLPELEVISSRA